MRKWWVFAVAALVLSAVGLSACSIQLKWFGAGGVDCEWDELRYKRDPVPSGTDLPDDALRREAEESMRQAEEEKKQLEFGACSENDLANRTCH